MIYYVWRIRLVCYLIRCGVGLQTAKTLYRLAVGNLSVIGWRRWICNHRYLWRPWESEYLRWRMLTVFRTPDNVTGKRFLAVMLLNKERLVEWIRWNEQMKGLGSSRSY